MNEKQRVEIVKLCKSIEKENGEGSIFQLGSPKAKLNIPRTSTGIEDLDNILGGGIPNGRLIEIYGPESSGKTSMAFHLASLYEMCLYIPAEGTFDAERAKVFGNKPKQLLVYNNEYGEDAMEKAIDFAKAGIPLIIIDSVPFLMPKTDFETVESNVEKDLRIGGVARLLTKTLPPLLKSCERTGTTVIFINQVRDKMDAMLFGEKTTTPGGHMLKHSCSLRMQVARKQWIEIPNKNPSNSAANEKIGLIMKGKVTKSKICNPYGEVELPMIFDIGFVSHDDLITIRKEKMAQNRKRKVDEEE